MSQTLVQASKAQLLEELELQLKTSAALVQKLQSDEHWDYTPGPNFRSTKELVHHLIGIPKIDLLILQENTGERILEEEKSIEALGTDQEQLASRLEAGLAELRSYMEGLSDEAYVQHKTTPFYVDKPTTQASWLAEISTHVAHHRSQLFHYLKVLGHPVSMFDLY